jgi:hypothetical protein
MRVENSYSFFLCDSTGGNERNSRENMIWSEQNAGYGYPRILFLYVSSVCPHENA